MATEPDPAALLAQRLRQLRTSHWRETKLTQAKLAQAFGVEAATISAWESATSGKTPSPVRLEAYARFFASRRSLEESPHLVAEGDLSLDEQDEYRQLHEQLLGLQNSHAQTQAESDTANESHLESERAAVRGTIRLRPRGIFTFAEGPVTVICPEAPESEQGPLASQDDPNYTKLQRYADLDALIELFGHLRAANPDLDVFHRIPARSPQMTCPLIWSCSAGCAGIRSSADSRRRCSRFRSLSSLSTSTPTATSSRSRSRR